MQFSEETRRADTVAPRAVIWSIAASAVLGMGFLLAVLFCIQVSFILLGLDTCLVLL